MMTVCLSEAVSANSDMAMPTMTITMTTDECNRFYQNLMNIARAIIEIVAGSHRPNQRN